MFLRFQRSTPIAALRVGDDAVVEGRVVAAKTITLPRTKLECVYYQQHVDAWERSARGAGRKMWMPVGSEERAIGFFLDDGGGRMWVSPDVAALSVSIGEEVRGAFDTKGSQRYVARVLRDGDLVRARGLVGEPKTGEPQEVLVLRAGGDGRRLELLLRKRSAP